MSKKPLLFDYDPQTDIVTIEGIRWSGNFFRVLGVHGLAVGTAFRIIKRDDGAIYLEQLKLAE